MNLVQLLTLFINFDYQWQIDLLIWECLSKETAFQTLEEYYAAVCGWENWLGLGKKGIDECEHQNYEK